MRIEFRSLIFAAALAAAPFSRAVNLIDNGGFETNTYNTGFLQWWGDVADGWKGINTPDMWDNNGDHGNKPGYNDVTLVGAKAHSGTKFAAMACNGSTGFYEGLTVNPNQNLVAGQKYTISAWLYSDTNLSLTPGLPPIRVSWGSSTILGSLGANTVRNQWQFRSINFTATADMASYRQPIQFFAFGDGNCYMGIDDVGLAKFNPVPETATLAPLVTGLLGFAGVRRPRLKSLYNKRSRRWNAIPQP